MNPLRIEDLIMRNQIVMDDLARAETRVRLAAERLQAAAKAQAAPPPSRAPLHFIPDPEPPAHAKAAAVAVVMALGVLLLYVGASWLDIIGG